MISSFQLDFRDPETSILLIAVNFDRIFGIEDPESDDFELSSSIFEVLGSRVC